MQLRVLTLNCWGLWLVAKRREERLRWLAEFLKSCSADIVLLQEVFVRSDVSMLIASAGIGSLTHAHFFHGGMLHGELLILSQHPILEAIPQN